MPQRCRKATVYEFQRYACLKIKKTTKKKTNFSDGGDVGDGVVREIYAIGSPVLHYTGDSKMKQFGHELTEL